MTNFTINNIGDDVIDLRDIIERVEELRTVREDFLAELAATAHGKEEELGSWLDSQWRESEETEEEAEELRALEAFLSDMAGNGGDEEWEGHWYPVTLIRESYFETYAEELAEDIGAINRDLSWPYTCIDWEKAARELAWDYSSAECQGITYMYL